MIMHLTQMAVKSKVLDMGRTAWQMIVQGLTFLLTIAFVAAIVWLVMRAFK
jgi:hypothetical protein